MIWLICVCITPPGEGDNPENVIEFWREIAARSGLIEEIGPEGVDPLIVNAMLPHARPLDMPLDLPIDEQPTSSAPETPAPPAIVATPWAWCNPASIPPRQFLYDRHLIRGYVSGTVAPGGLGKSSLIIGETLAMVTGKPLLGKPVPSGPLRVWLWNLEDPQEELDRRIAAACQHHGLTADDLGDRLHVNSGRNQPCVVARMTAGGATIIVPVVGAIVAEIKARQIDVLSIDPFVSCHQVPENDNGAQDSIVKEFGRVADDSRGNCAIELVHHVRKLGDNEATADSARGGGSFVAGLRDLRVLNRMTKDEAERVEVETPRAFRIFNSKQISAISES